MTPDGYSIKMIITTYIIANFESIIWFIFDIILQFPKYHVAYGVPLSGPTKWQGTEIRAWYCKHPFSCL